MKAGLVYALCLVIALLVFVILIQHRQMSSLHNDVMRMGADSRSLHSLMYRDDMTNAAELKRLERENSELRDDLNRLQNESRTNRKSSGTTGSVSGTMPF